jgi:hypothetical protein
MDQRADRISNPASGHEVRRKLRRGCGYLGSQSVAELVRPALSERETTRPRTNLLAVVPPAPHVVKIEPRLRAR